MTKNGVYKLQYVLLTDTEGGEYAFERRMLSKAGIQLDFTVSGALSDTEPPALLSLDVPAATANQSSVITLVIEERLSSNLFSNQPSSRPLK